MQNALVQVMLTHITLKSGNEKTGPIPVSTSSSDTCPSTCPLLATKGCYAKHGPLGWHWNKVSNGLRGNSWSDFIATVKSLADGQLWRHNQAGDLPGKDTNIDASQLAELTAANQGKRGFTYTHKPMTSHTNKDAVKLANENGFTVNLSANNLEHADELKELNIAPVVVVLPENAERKLNTPKGNTVIVCPAQQRDDVTCASCKLCSIANRKVIIGFRAHGTSKARVSKLVK